MPDDLASNAASEALALYESRMANANRYNRFDGLVEMRDELNRRIDAIPRDDTNAELDKLGHDNILIAIYRLCYANFVSAQELLAMANALDDKITALQKSVAALTTVEESAVALLQSLGQQLKDALAAAAAAGATTAQLQAFTDLDAAIDARKDDLAAAVAANTPAVTG